MNTETTFLTLFLITFVHQTRTAERQLYIAADSAAEACALAQASLWGRSEYYEMESVAKQGLVLVPVPTYAPQCDEEAFA